jgi:hypothetical protein
VLFSISGDVAGTLGAGAVATLDLVGSFGDSSQTIAILDTHRITINQPGSFSIPFFQEMLVGIPSYDEFPPYGFVLNVGVNFDLTGGPGTVSLDPGVSVSTATAVPEPSSLVIFGMAALSLTGARFARRRLARLI